MICQQCGMQIPDGTKFCTFCGAKVTNMVAAAAEPVQEAASDMQQAFAPEAEAPMMYEEAPAAPVQDAPFMQEEPAPVPVQDTPFMQEEPAPAPVQDVPFMQETPAQPFNPQPQPQFNPQPQGQFQPQPQPQFQPQGQFVPQGQPGQFQPQGQPQFQPQGQPQFQPGPYGPGPQQPGQFGPQGQPGQFQPGPYGPGPQNVPTGGKPGKQPKQPKQPGKKGGKAGLIIGIIAGVVVIAGIIAAILLFSKKKAPDVTVNLNDYIVVEFTGYDTLGEAEAYIDYDQLRTDFADKLVWTGKKKQQPTDKLPIDYLVDNVYVMLDNYYDLSNGDTIEVTVYDYFSSYEESYPDAYANNAVIQYTDEKITVQGLKEAETFDPFEGAVITFTGKEGDSDMTYEWRSDLAVMNDLYITYDFDAWTLHNGDVVKFYIYGYDEYSASYLIGQYGMIPSRTEYEVTVSGLSTEHYITDTAEIPTEVVEGLKSAYQSWAQSDWGNLSAYGLSLKNITYLGYTYCTLKEGSYDIDQNAIYAKFQVEVNYTNPSNQPATFTYYTYANISDLYVNADGSITFWEGTYDDFYGPSSSSFFQVDLNNNNVLTCYGFQTLDAMNQSIATDRSTNYNLVEVTP